MPKKVADHCPQCQAISTRTGRRCFNLAQCRVPSTAQPSKSVALCNVHAAQVQRAGFKSIQLADSAGTRFASTARDSKQEQRALATLAVALAAEQAAQRQQLLHNAASLQRIEQQLMQQQQQRTTTPAAPPPVLPASKTSSATDDVVFSKQSQRVARQLLTLARLVHAEVNLTRALIKRWCASADSRQVQQAVQPVFDFVPRVDALLAQLKQNASQSDNDQASIDAVGNQLADVDALAANFAAASDAMRRRLAHLCKNNQFALRPSLRFTLDMASGAIKCNERDIPHALRAWFVRGQADVSASGGPNQPQWTDRMLYCNLGARTGGSDTLAGMGAFERDQALRNGFSVYAAGPTVTAIGRKKQGDAEQQPPDGNGGSFASQTEASSSEADAEAAVRSYMAWLQTLGALIELHALLGLDPSALMYERLVVDLQLAAAALTLGAERATQLLNAQRFERLVQLARLASAYGDYLNEPLGVAGLAALAAYDAYRANRGRVSAPTLRRLTRGAFLQALPVLTLLGGSGALALMQWLDATAQPTVPTPTASSFDPGAVPVFNVGRNVSAALRQALLNSGGTLDGTERSLNLGRSAYEQLSSRNARLRATLPALNRTRVTPQLLMSTALMPQALLTPGGLLSPPRTREQWRRAIAQPSPLQLLSPTTLQVADMFQQRDVQRVIASMQRRLPTTPVVRAPLLAARPALALPAGAAPALPSGAASSSSVQPPAAAAATVGASLASLAGLVPSLVAGVPAEPVDFAPDIERLLQSIQSTGEELQTNRSAVQQPIAFPSAEQAASMFATPADALNAIERGLAERRQFQLLQMRPGANARRRYPDLAAAMSWSVQSAQQQLTAQGNRTALADLGAALPSRVAARALNAPAFTATPSALLRTVSGGGVFGPLSGTDVGALQRELQALSAGNASSASDGDALDDALENVFRSLDRVGHAAQAAASDAAALVGSVQSNAALVVREQFDALTAAGRRQVSLLLSTPEALHGFLMARYERLQQQARLLANSTMVAEIKRAAADALASAQANTLLALDTLQRSALDALTAADQSTMDLFESIGRLAAQQALPAAQSAVDQFSNVIVPSTQAAVASALQEARVGVERAFARTAASVQNSVDAVKTQVRDVMLPAARQAIFDRAMPRLKSSVEGSINAARREINAAFDSAQTQVRDVMLPAGADAARRAQAAIEEARRAALDAAWNAGQAGVARAQAALQRQIAAVLATAAGGVPDIDPTVYNPNVFGPAALAEQQRGERAKEQQAQAAARQARQLEAAIAQQRAVDEQRRLRAEQQQVQQQRFAQAARQAQSVVDAQRAAQRAQQERDARQLALALQRQRALDEQRRLRVEEETMQQQQFGRSALAAQQALERARRAAQRDNLRRAREQAQAIDRQATLDRQRQAAAQRADLERFLQRERRRVALAPVMPVAAASPNALPQTPADYVLQHCVLGDAIAQSAALNAQSNATQTAQQAPNQVRLASRAGGSFEAALAQQQADAAARDDSYFAQVQRFVRWQYCMVRAVEGEASAIWHVSALLFGNPALYSSNPNAAAQCAAEVGLAPGELQRFVAHADVSQELEMLPELMTSMAAAVPSVETVATAASSASAAAAATAAAAGSSAAPAAAAQATSTIGGTLYEFLSTMA